MKLVEVSPISSKVQKDSLTYFSAKDISIGDIVEIEVRKKKYDALVVDVRDAKDLKQEIKTATFGFKKIESVKGKSKFYKEFFNACEETKEFFVGNLGQIVNFFLPIELLENYESLQKPKKRAVGSSVYHVAPTVLSAKIIHEQLSRSNLNNSFLIHGNLGRKKQTSIYKEIIDSKNPVTVVMTPSFVFIPRHDLGKIVIHDEHSSAYRTIKRPYFDLRFFLKVFAKEMKIKIEFDGLPLTVETVLGNNLSIPGRGSTSTSFKTIDMSDKENRHSKSFIFSKEVFEEIKLSDKAFAFVLRKGLGSSVVCHDCGHIIKDGDTALVLRERSGERILLNPQTGATLDPKTRCGNCGSWNFDTLGIGTDTVTEETKKLFPEKPIFQIDGDITKTDKKIREVVEKFYITPNSILVGTELAIPYLDKPLNVSTIITMDSLLSIPSYKIYEKMVHLGLAVKNLSPKTILQTRDTDNPAVIALTSGNLKDFYDSEKEMREKFGYPPFGTIVRISRTSNKDDFDRAAGPLVSTLSPWDPIARRIKRGKIFETIIILKLSKKTWNENSQDQNLFEILAALGPEWQIRINPENLF